MNQTELQIEQLQDFQLWKNANGDGFTLLDYLTGVANIEIAIAFTKLFWPDFVEYKGGIFLADGFAEQIYNEWHEKMGDNITAIEQVMNHTHISDLLPGSENVTFDNLLYLGQTISQMWESRLGKLYPDKHFLVRCESDQENDDVVVILNQK